MVKYDNLQIDKDRIINSAIAREVITFTVLVTVWELVLRDRVLGWWS